MLLPGADVTQAEAEIVEVLLRESAVFVRVHLRRYYNEDGTPLEARCRLVVPYAGAGYGDWHVPEPGEEVFCAFPGIGPEGVPGGDFDEGYVLGKISSAIEPPVTTGQAGALSASRRVYKSKSGEARDEHHQGAVDGKVDGAWTWLVTGIAKLVGGPFLRLFATAVEIGADGGTFQKLVNEAGLAKYNAHTHSGGSPPDAAYLWVADVDTTATTKAS